MSPLKPFANQRADSYIRLIAILLLIVLTISLGYALRYTLSCFLLSFVLAYLFDPLVELLGRRKLSRLRSIIVLYLVLGVITAFTLTVLLPKLTIGWYNFLQNLPLYLQKLKQLLLSWQDRLPTHYGSEEINWMVDNFTANADKMVRKDRQLVLRLCAWRLFQPVQHHPLADPGLFHAILQTEDHRNLLLMDTAGAS